METTLLSSKKEDILKAGEIIKNGGLVAIPTETVYGLAANALDGEAVKHIFEAKGRPSDNPLIVHISKFSQIKSIAKEIPESAKLLAEKFWPGPLTIILNKLDIIPEETSGGLNTVAIRLPKSEIARAVIDASGCPIAAPSANLSGKPSPTKFSHVVEDLNGRVDAILDGGDCEVGVESTVITLANGAPKILRPGGVSLEEIREVLPSVKLDKAVFEHISTGEKVSSPGMKYTHYAPKAEITIVDSSPDVFYQFVNNKAKNVAALCFDEDIGHIKVPCVSYGKRYDSELQARELFTALHKLDELKEKIVFARIPRRTGVGSAVYNRLIRAAGFRKIVPDDRFIIGLTGPTGSGKSESANELKALGYGVVDADKVSKMPGVYDKACIDELKCEFGDDIEENGKLNRRKLSENAFSHPSGKERLEKIVFPRILVKLNEEIQREYDEGKRIIAIDGPTLFEAGLDKYCARIAVVTAPSEIRLERIIKRDNISEELALKRMNAQKSESFFISRADFVLDGGKDIESLKEETRKMIREINKDLERSM